MNGKAGGGDAGRGDAGRVAQGGGSPRSAGHGLPGAAGTEGSGTTTTDGRTVATLTAEDAATTVATIDWPRVGTELDDRGAALIRGLLGPAACLELTQLYALQGDAGERTFRSRVVMERHGYGRGEYRYFAYPLPPLVAALREAAYPPLARIANRWNETLAVAPRFPDRHAEFIARCHAAGQRRPTPLLLRYGAGDYNCLHQDLYGEQVFPLQMVILLSEPGRDFEGGEFVMTEQRPRMQSRPMVLPLRRGDAAVIAVHHRPVRGARGVHRVNLRHGVSQVLAGQRHALGIIFHDAN